MLVHQRVRSDKSWDFDVPYFQTKPSENQQTGATCWPQVSKPTLSNQQPLADVFSKSGSKRSWWSHKRNTYQCSIGHIASYSNHQKISKNKHEQPILKWSHPPNIRYPEMKTWFSIGSIHFGCLIGVFHMWLDVNPNFRMVRPCETHFDDWIMLNTNFDWSKVKSQCLMVNFYLLMVNSNSLRSLHLFYPASSIDVRSSISSPWGSYMRFTKLCAWASQTNEWNHH